MCCTFNTETSKQTNLLEHVVDIDDFISACAFINKAMTGSRSSTSNIKLKQYETIDMPLIMWIPLLNFSSIYLYVRG